MEIHFLVVKDIMPLYTEPERKYLKASSSCFVVFGRNKSHKESPLLIKSEINFKKIFNVFEFLTFWHGYFTFYISFSLHHIHEHSDRNTSGKAQSQFKVNKTFTNAYMITYQFSGSAQSLILHILFLILDFDLTS